jgi:hypothetical protein
VAHISGTFSNANPGRLLMILWGTFYQNTYRDAGFPQTATSPGNILIDAFIGPTGDRQHCQPIDRYAPVSLFTREYPGGNVSWDVGTREVARINPSGGIWNYGMSKLTITLLFVMK